MERKQLPILSIVTVGSPEFPRYMIADPENRLWNGKVFTDEGLVYGGYGHAALDYQNLLRAPFAGVKPQIFSAPCVVEVFSDEPVHIAKVARHLSMSARLHLNTPEHGHGPEGSLVLASIDWSRIEEVPGER